MSPIVNYRRELAMTTLLTSEVRDVVHEVLFAYDETHRYLARNEIRRSDLFAKLYHKKAPALDVAEGLVAGNLSASDRLLMARREKRSSVLRQFFRGHTPTAEEQELLCAAPSPGGARLMLDYPWLDVHYRRKLALKAQGRDLLREMAFGRLEDFSDGEVLALLADHASWRPGSQRGEVRFILAELFTRRPQLISPALDIDFGRNRYWVLASMASSSSLSPVTAALVQRSVTGASAWDFYSYVRHVGARLIENPRTPLDVVQALSQSDDRAARLMLEPAVRRRDGRGHIEPDAASLTDPQQIERLANFCAPRNLLVLSPSTTLTLLTSGYAPAALRERLRESLGRLPHLSQGFACVNAATLTGLGVTVRNSAPNAVVYGSPASRPGIDESIKKAIACFAADRVKWETLIGLASEFDGDFDALLEVSSLV